MATVILLICHVVHDLIKKDVTYRGPGLENKKGKEIGFELYVRDRQIRASAWKGA